MYCEFPAINLNDWFSLVSVWEQSSRGWRRLSTVRQVQAKKLCNQPNRLVFPTDINLNPRNNPCNESYNFCKSISRKERLLEIIKLSPGLTSILLAKKLDVNVSQLRHYLKTLQDAMLIHYCPDSSNKKIKRYYLGEKPMIVESNNNFNVVEPKPKLPEVRVYFVNPRLLQN